MAENKEFYLVIKGEKIIVSEEVYRAYKSSDRAERKRKQRMWRCRIKREKGINNQWKRCQGNCEECGLENTLRKTQWNCRISCDYIRRFVCRSLLAFS